MASSNAELVAEADRLNRSGEWREAYEYLKPHCDDSTDPEVLWRLLRAFYRVGKFLAKDKQEKEYIMQKGVEIMESALKLHENDFNVQKVSSIFHCVEIWGVLLFHASAVVRGFPQLAKWSCWNEM